MWKSSPAKNVNAEYGIIKGCAANCDQGIWRSYNEDKYQVKLGIVNKTNLYAQGS